MDTNGKNENEKNNDSIASRLKRSRSSKTVKKAEAKQPPAKKNKKLLVKKTKINNNTNNATNNTINNKKDDNTMLNKVTDVKPKNQSISSTSLTSLKSPLFYLIF